MIRSAFWSGVALSGLLWSASFAFADVNVRAPFVRVEVSGPGVHVRAPFVNIWVPSRTPVYVVPATKVVTPMPAASDLPVPNVVPAEPAPPQPLQTRHPTLEEFAKTFQPKAGHYDVTIVNPITKQPTPVRFSLPEGNPRRVHVNRREIEFDYGIRHFVRIQFDDDGAFVISR